MSETEKTPAPESQEPKKGCGCADQDHILPEVSFTTFILSLASSGLVQLGEVPDPATGQTQENLLVAKHTIDVLSMLRAKTKACLEEEESKLLDALLYELRMKYVLKAG